MIEKATVDALRAKFKDVHPLLFHRSLERAKTGGELFDMLSTIPDKYPVIWDEGMRRWTYTDDPLQGADFKLPD